MQLGQQGIPAMEYRQLGDSGLKGSPNCLGAKMFGSASDDKTTGRIVDSARKHGVNFSKWPMGTAAVIPRKSSGGF